MVSERAPEDVPRTIGRLDRAALADRIDAFLLARMDPAEATFPVRLVWPRLSWNRLDIAVKLHYLVRTAEGRGRFARDLYDAHIHAFSLGDFREPGNELKTDAASFRHAFDRIVESVRVQGFDPGRSLVPVAADGTYVNGGHRVATALFLGLPIPVVETGLPPVRYDHGYFRRRGMDEDLIAAAAFAYLEHSPTASLAIGAGDATGPVVYRGRLQFTPQGRANLDRALLLIGAAGSRRSAAEALLPAAGLLDAAIVDQAGTAPAHGAVLPAQPGTTGQTLARMVLSDPTVRFLNAARADAFPWLEKLAVGTASRATPRPEMILGPDVLLAALGRGPVPGPDREPWIDAPEVDAATLADIAEDPRRHVRLGDLVLVSPTEALRLERSRADADPARLGEIRRLARGDRLRGYRRTLGSAARMRISRMRRRVILLASRLGIRAELRRAYLALARGRR